jgi:hypothetical protein
VPRRRRRGDLPPHSLYKTLGRSRRAGVIDYEHAFEEERIPCCLFDIRYHHSSNPPIHHRARYTRIHGSFSLITHNFHLHIPAVSNKDFLLPQFCSVFTHSHNHTHVCLSVLRMSKKGSYFRLMTYTFLLTCAKRRPKGGCEQRPKKKNSPRT